MSDFENPLASKSDDGDVKKKLTNGKKWTIGLGVVGILVMIYLYSKSKSSSSSSSASTTAPNAAGISSTMAAEQSGASAQAQLDQQMLQNAMSTSSVLGTSPGYTTSGGAPSSGYNINPGGQMITAPGSGGGSSTGTTPSTTSTTPPTSVSEYMFSAPGTNNGVTTTISGSAPVMQGSGYNASTNPHYLALSNPTQYGMAVNRHATIDYQPSLGTFQPSFGQKLAPNTTLFAVT